MYTKEVVEKLHSLIREDIINNQSEILNRMHYYTHKHRSQDRLLDVNVGIFLNENYEPTCQIYVGIDSFKIREQFTMNNYGNIINTKLITKEYE